MSDKDEENQKTHFRSWFCKHCQKSDINDELLSCFWPQKYFTLPQSLWEMASALVLDTLGWRFICLRSSGSKLITGFPLQQNARRESVVARHEVVTSRSRLIPWMPKGISNLDGNLNLTVKVGYYPRGDTFKISYREPDDLGKSENDCSDDKRTEPTHRL